jgi:hypothetical protein
VFNKIVEQIIQEAIEAGEFDNLKGKGRPISHDEYFSVPPDRRLGYTALKNAGFVPEEVALFKEVEALKERFEAETEPTRRDRLKRELRDARLKLDLMLERRKLRK